MHSDILSIRSLSLSDACPLPGPPPGSNLKHERWADSNAGDRGLIPDPMFMPPPALGSGKFEMPCERMQAANLSPALAKLDRLLAFEDPQAAMTSTQLTAASAIVPVLVRMRAIAPSRMGPL